MKREDALKEIRAIQPFGAEKSLILINEIYDHFEQQQLENLAHLQMANSLIEKLKKELKECKGSIDVE